MGMLMALPVREQAKYWGIAAAVFLLALWFLGDVILPFVLGGAVAYCLDPIADRLERMGASRGLATGIITFFAILVFNRFRFDSVITTVGRKECLCQ